MPLEARAIRAQRYLAQRKYLKYHPSLGTSPCVLAVNFSIAELWSTFSYTPRFSHGGLCTKLLLLYCLCTSSSTSSSIGSLYILGLRRLAAFTVLLYSRRY